MRPHSTCRKSIPKPPAQASRAKLSETLCAWSTICLGLWTNNKNTTQMGWDDQEFIVLAKMIPPFANGEGIAKDTPRHPILGCTWVTQCPLVGDHLQATSNIWGHMSNICICCIHWHYIMPCKIQYYPIPYNTTSILFCFLFIYI